MPRRLREKRGNPPLVCGEYMADLKSEDTKARLQALKVLRPGTAPRPSTF